MIYLSGAIIVSLALYCFNRGATINSLNADNDRLAANISSLKTEKNCLVSNISSLKTEKNCLVSNISSLNERILNLSGEKQLIKEMLEKAGFNPSDLNLLTSSDVVVSPKYTSRVSKYIANIRRIRLEKKLWAEHHPVAYGAAPALLDEASSSLDEKSSKYLETYRLECLANATKNKLVAPISFSPTIATIERVIDGDTLKVIIKGTTHNVRLIGFDSPETVHPTKGVGYYGPESSQYMSDLVAKLGSGCLIWIDETAKTAGWPPFDKYSRLCAHISIGNVLLGEAMLSSGHADFIDAFPYDVSIMTKYRVARDTAKLDDVGMWKALNNIQKKRWNLDPLKVTKKLVAVQEIGTLLKGEDSLREMLRETFKQLSSSLTVKSRNSAIVHDVNCHFVSRIKEQNRQQIESTDNITICKHCGGDPILDTDELELD